MKQSYDDLAGCIVQSLNDNFADYCFTDTQLSCVKARLRREGNTSFIFKFVKKNDNRYSYYQLIPVKIYKRFGNKDMLLPRLSIDAEKIPDRYKVEYVKGFYKINIKDYNADLDVDNLKRVMRLTNEENV